VVTARSTYRVLTILFEYVNVLPVEPARWFERPTGDAVSDAHSFGNAIDDPADASEYPTILRVDDLEAFSTVLVRTTHSVYRIVTTISSEIYVQGGAFFPDPTPAYLEGSRIAANCLLAGRIGIGGAMMIRTPGYRVITSPVRAVIVQRGRLSAQ